VIYQRTLERTTILITIYSKSEQEGIGAKEIRQIISDYEAQQSTPAIPDQAYSD
jgi:hypothetical protein